MVANPGIVIVFDFFRWRAPKPSLPGGAITGTVTNDQIRRDRLVLRGRVYVIHSFHDLFTVHRIAPCHELLAKLRDECTAFPRNDDSMLFPTFPIEVQPVEPERICLGGRPVHAA